MTDFITELTAGMPILFGGNRVTHVDQALADAYKHGDHVVVVQSTGDLLHIPADDWDIAAQAIAAASGAFAHMGAIADDAISAFYQHFADRLASDATFGAIAEANAADVEAARGRNRSTTRLELSAAMRADMIEALHMWRDASSSRGEIIETITHDGWHVDQAKTGLGVVGFVFEGRPNVFADATGVLRSGNTVVFRIGSDALGTAKAIVEHALDPAIEAAGLPAGAVTLVASPSRASGWALFSQPSLALAIARGSGAAVAQLGAVARQAGIPVSLHGTGGAWIVAGEHADADAFADAVFHSLDRKVCNTLNTCCIVESRASELVPVFLDALDRAGQRRGAVSKLHVEQSSADAVPAHWFEPAEISRAEGLVTEPRTDTLRVPELGREWEWEESPEVTLAVVPDAAVAVELFNQHSPRFIASLVSSDAEAQQRFYDSINAPFVGNGFTRWVDGQYALKRPELGLSNWQFGRLFSRGGVLSGDSVYSVRSRVTQNRTDIGR